MSDFLLLDNARVPFRPGQSVLEAARSADVFIPSLCFHRKTGVLSACRICVVQVERAPGLHPSCGLAAAAGMVVRTDSHAIRAARRCVIDLLLSSGSHDCHTCAAAGRCDLQEAAAAAGVEKASFFPLRTFPPLDDSSPLIVRDPSRCIHCGRCVAACNDVVAHGVLGVAGRSALTRRIICDDDRPMGSSSCVQCGECVQACPTGALLDKASARAALPEGLDVHRTVCPYCGVGCGLLLHVDRRKGRIAAVTGDEGHPASDGMLCVKGRYGLDFVHSEERLRAPLVRRDGVLRRSSWNEALAIVGKGLAQARDLCGPGSVAGLSSAKCTNEENYLFQKLFRQVLGSNSVDHCARLCHSSTVTGLGQAIGSAAMSNDIAGIAEADVILVTGSDTTTAHPVIASRILRAVHAGQTRLIVIDPRRPRLADNAHIYAQPRCGTDVALINGLMHIIIANGWEDRSFIEERCTGYGNLKSLVAQYDPATVEDITSVPSGLLEEIAALFGQAGTASIFYAMGITQHTTGTDNVRSLANLQLLCGNFGLRGGGLNPLRGQCNVQGACDMGALPASLPGYASLGSSADTARFESAWGTSLPATAGLTAMEIIDAAHRGDLKALYIMGENPCLSDPDISHVKMALRKLDFLVVQDIFLTETAHLAHVVLPAACFAEKDGLFTSTERRVQRVRKVLDPPGEAREDWRIITDVARQLGKNWHYRTAEDIHDEVRRLVPAYRGIDWRKAGDGGVQWPCPADDHPGTAILHGEGFPVRRARMKGAHFRPPREEPDEDFPFVLTTGRLLPQFHTGTMSRKSPGLDRLARPAVEIAPGDAAALGIVDGDPVELSTRRGTLTAPASLTDRLPRGTLFMAFHFAEAAANLLTNPARDPESGIPEFKVCAAALKKVPQRLPRPQT